VYALPLLELVTIPFTTSKRSGNYVFQLSMSNTQQTGPQAPFMSIVSILKETALIYLKSIHLLFFSMGTVSFEEVRRFENIR
jgi:hypothetical protein